MTLTYSKPSRLSGRRLVRLIAVACVVLGACYLLAYAIAFSRREPAANMAYFVYDENGTIDGAAYSLFYPVYFVHTRVFAGQRHNRDRIPLTSLRDTPIEL